MRKSTFWIIKKGLLNSLNPCLKLTLMLLVANLTHTKWCKKTEKWLKPWHMGTHLRVLCESYPMNANMTGFRWFSKNLCILVLWTEVALALEGLRPWWYYNNSFLSGAWTYVLISCLQSIFLRNIWLWNLLSMLRLTIPLKIFKKISLYIKLSSILGCGVHIRWERFTDLVYPSMYLWRI